MRFVLLHHTGWPEHLDHYDLLLQLESGSSDDDYVLKAFAAESFPVGGSKLRLQAPHRRAYLTYEGPIAKSRGKVTRVDEGEYELSPVGSGDMRLHFKGVRLKGEYLLRAVGGAEYLFESTP